MKGTCVCFQTPYVTKLRHSVLAIYGGLKFIFGAKNVISNFERIPFRKAQSNLNFLYNIEKYVKYTTKKWPRNGFQLKNWHLVAARDQFCHYKVGGSCFLKWSQIESCEENNFFRDALAKHRLIEPFFEFLHRFCTRGVQSFCTILELLISIEWLKIGEIWNHFLVWNFQSSTSLEICIVAKFLLQVRIFSNYLIWQKLQFANGARYSKIEKTTFVDLKNTRSFYSCQFFDPTHSF